MKSFSRVTGIREIARKRHSAWLTLLVLGKPKRGREEFVGCRRSGSWVFDEMHLQSGSLVLVIPGQIALLSDVEMLDLSTAA
jgi:hypothetical protein